MTVFARDICVDFEDFSALKSVDFDARPGRVSTIVGPNGSGKTTLLRAMTGDLPFRGSVHLNGLDISAVPPLSLATQRAVLPQSGTVAFPFTVLELVRLGLTAGLATTRDVDLNSLPIQALARVGLGGYEGRLVQELSGGERQRAQLARVLVQIWQPVLDGTPRWLFLDEPVSALDIGHQLLIMQIARGFAEAGGGVIAVMHDLNLTSMYSDRVTLLAQGEVVATGSPSEVLTDINLSNSYGCDLRTNTPPQAGGPWILPQAAGAHHL